MKGYKRFEIYLNFSCNQRCIHCFNGEDFRRAHRDLDFAVVSSSLLKMRKKGYDWLSLLGGEPTVYPEILKVVSLARKLGYRRIMTFSNGLKYSQRSFVSDMRMAGLTDTCLSMHGDRSYLHEAVTQVPGSFNRVLGAIDNLKEEKINIMVILVLNALNYKYFPRMVRFFLDKGIKNYMFFALKYQGRMNEGGAGKLAVRLSEAFSQIGKVKKIFSDRGLKFPTILHVPPCVLPDYVEFLDNYSTSPSSMLLQDGNTFGMGNAHKDLIFKPSCRSCKYYRGCSGFDPVYADYFSDDEFKPVTGLKKKKSFKKI
ncbi:MAG: hypothetical protein Fur0012_11830 [Elusimicrobiota bacterium]